MFQDVTILGTSMTVQMMALVDGTLMTTGCNCIAEMQLLTLANQYLLSPSLTTLGTPTMAPNAGHGGPWADDH